MGVPVVVGLVFAAYLLLLPFVTVLSTTATACANRLHRNPHVRMVETALSRAWTLLRRTATGGVRGVADVGYLLAAWLTFAGWAVLVYPPSAAAWGLRRAVPLVYEACFAAFCRRCCARRRNARIQAGLRARLRHDARALLAASAAPVPPALRLLALPVWREVEAALLCCGCAPRSRRTRRPPRPWRGTMRRPCCRAPGASGW